MSLSTQEIYFDSSKVFKNILFAFGIWVGIYFYYAVISLINVWVILGTGFVIFISFSLLYFASKSMSRKPQLIISDDGLYVHFHVKKIIPWKNIEKVSVKKHDVDYRSIYYMTLTTRLSTGKMYKQEFPVETLELDPQELENLISDRIFQALVK